MGGDSLNGLPKAGGVSNLPVFIIRTACLDRGSNHKPPQLHSRFPFGAFLSIRGQERAKATFVVWGDQTNC